MNKNIKSKLAIIFLIILIPFVALALLSIWDVVTEDVLWRAIATIGVLSASVIIAMAVLNKVDINTK